MRRTVRFLGIMLAGALLAHVAFSAAVSAWIAGTYRHRLFNVRNVEDATQWGPLARLFVEGQSLDDPRPKILLFGSSFTWGYSWPEEDVFSWHLQEAMPEYQVLNLAVIGQDMSGLLKLACDIHGTGIKSIFSVVEVNLFNLRPQNLSLDSQPCTESSHYHALGGLINYFHFTISHPWGLEYPRTFWNEYDYQQPERQFSWTPLPNSYFPDLTLFKERQIHIKSTIERAIELVSTFSNSIYLFVAPTLQEGAELSKYPPENLQTIADMIVSFCASSPITLCLDPGLGLPRNDFGNLTHLNMAGHRAFGSWLLSHMDRWRVELSAQ